MSGKPKQDQKDDAQGGDVQGEGDYRSAREFNEKERSFVRSHDMHGLAERAAPRDADQAAEFEAAEREGKAHAKPDPEADKDQSAGPKTGSDRDDSKGTGRASKA